VARASSAFLSSDGLIKQNQTSHPQAGGGYCTGSARATSRRHLTPTSPSSINFTTATSGCRPAAALI